MKKWEYKILYESYNDKPVDLNEYGSQGWELVAVIYSDEVYTYYFKRQINENETRI